MRYSIAILFQEGYSTFDQKVVDGAEANKKQPKQKERKNVTQMLYHD